MLKKITLTLGTVAALTLGMGMASGDDFPSKPITWIVPYTPGGITDTRARLIGEEFGKELGETVVVENKPGAGGTLGVEYVARAEPDGYTIIYGSLGTLAAAPSLYKDLRYEPVEDFIPVQMMGLTANTLIAYHERPYDTAKELVAYAKEHPGEVTVGLAGIGTGTHLAAELFKNVAEVDLLMVPYQGSAPMLNDLIAGRIDIGFDYPVSSNGHVEGGAVKVLAVTGETRNPLFPNTATMKEQGFSGATTGSWSGIFVPAGTPQDRVEVLREAFTTAMASEVVVDQFQQVASDIISMEPDEMNAFLSSELERWTKIIEEAGIEKK